MRISLWRTTLLPEIMSCRASCFEFSAKKTTYMASKINAARDATRMPGLSAYQMGVGKLLPMCASSHGRSLIIVRRIDRRNGKVSSFVPRTFKRSIFFPGVPRQDDESNTAKSRTTGIETVASVYNSVFVPTWNQLSEIPTASRKGVKTKSCVIAKRRKAKAQSMEYAMARTVSPALASVLSGDAPLLSFVTALMETPS